MPNFDAGHYFLTIMAPLRADPVQRDGQTHSRRHLVKEALSAIPTGERTVASQGKGPANPFARTTRTHFARFFLLEDVVFNGRASGNSLLDRIRGLDPIVPQRVDHLSTPFLVFVADFDAGIGDDHDLKSYAMELWVTMQDELTEIFGHCVAFDAIHGADRFFRYLKKCQIETTMPFNDYWSAPPALHSFELAPYLVAAGLAVLAFIAGMLAGHGWLTIIGLLALALNIYLALRKLIDTAAIPFPRSPAPAPGSDLPTVLKALRVQRAFTEFAIQAQTLRTAHAGDQALYAAFGAFLSETRPDDVTTSTQLPGIIGV